MNVETVKEIIKSNEEFILNDIQTIIKRENIFFPSGVRKVNIIHGVRRSGETFLLYSLFKENPSHSLYIDFEDDRLKDCIIYRVVDKNVYVLLIADGRRDMQTLLQRRLLDA